jgi:MYXO-CTERM domain-containing protein
MRHGLPWICASIIAGIALEAHADLWRDVTDTALGVQTSGWSNKVELADLDGDGRVDLLFANGGNYNEIGEPELSGAWRNTGNDASGVPQLEDVSDAVFGGQAELARSMCARDFDGDGNVDIVVGANYETRARLLMGTGGGAFEDKSDLLPAIGISAGDIEAADIDDDGDLDLVIADWGLDDGSGGLLDPFTAPGAPPLLWLNELSSGNGFVDATAERMDDVPVAWSWELDLWDVDGDFDLDLLVSCKVCTGSSLYRNEDGTFVHDPGALPQFTNNYDFEAMWIVPPGDTEPSLAVVTINDGDRVSHEFDLREHLFVADASGNFRDRTDELWPDGQNAGADDNMVVVLDFDSDGDPDFLIGALGEGDDRLHVNDLAGEGVFVLDRNAGVATGLSGTPGTLGIALADLNGDGKLDVVQSQGELAEPEKVYLGDEIAPDTAAPVVGAMRIDRAEDGSLVVKASVHDNQSPIRPHDWKSAVVRVTVDGDARDEIALAHMGGFLWRAELEAPEGDAVELTVCATDAAGNEACGEPTALEGDAKTDDLDAGEGDADGEGCGCRSDRPHRDGAWLVLAAIGLASVRRRRA